MMSVGNCYITADIHQVLLSEFSLLVEFLIQKSTNQTWANISSDDHY